MPFIYLTDAGRDLPASVQERVGTCLEHGLHCLVQTVGVHAVAGVEEFGVRDRDEVVRVFCTFISEPLVENVSKKRETEWSITISYGINLSI